MEGQNWLDAGEALADVADMARLYDADGIDIYFLNNQRSLLDVRVSTSVSPWWGIGSCLCRAGLRFAVSSRKSFQTVGIAQSLVPQCLSEEAHNHRQARHRPGRSCGKSSASTSPDSESKIRSRPASS